jgi:hypothetical protein
VCVLLCDSSRHVRRELCVAEMSKHAVTGAIVQGLGQCRVCALRTAHTRHGRHSPPLASMHLDLSKVSVSSPVSVKFRLWFLLVAASALHDIIATGAPLVTLKARFSMHWGVVASSDRRHWSTGLKAVGKKLVVAAVQFWLVAVVQSETVRTCPIAVLLLGTVRQRMGVW